MPFKSRLNNDFNFLLVNARSLENKLDSLVETMTELETEVAVVTETWFVDGEGMNEKFEKLKHECGYEILTKIGVNGGEVE